MRTDSTRFAGRPIGRPLLARRGLTQEAINGRSISQTDSLLLACEAGGDYCNERSTRLTGSAAGVPVPRRAPRQPRQVLVQPVAVQSASGNRTTMSSPSRYRALTVRPDGTA